MGWWKMNNSGGIDWNRPGLQNALPGDTPENHYNGDGPADIMDNSVRNIRQLCPDLLPKEIRKLFLKNTIPGSLILSRFKEVRTKLLKIVEDTWKEIDEEYNMTWGRKAYPEEREGICAFCIH